MIVQPLVRNHDGPSGSRVQVDESLLRELVRNGFRDPIRSFADPRIHYPELLLVSGWERHETEGGAAYRRVVEGDVRVEQVVIYGPQSTRRLVTRAGERFQVLRWTPGRGVEEIERR